MLTKHICSHLTFSQDGQQNGRFKLLNSTDGTKLSQLIFRSNEHPAFGQFLEQRNSAPACTALQDGSLALICSGLVGQLRPPELHPSTGTFTASKELNMQVLYCDAFTVEKCKMWQYNGACGYFTYSTFTCV